MSSNAKTVSALALAGALGVAFATLSGAPAAAQQDMEKCYGVAKAGQNDCKAGAHACKGHSTADYDPNSFKMVPKGTCTSMTTPAGKSGSLEPMDS